jgi:DNA-binding CsgD family transcriptional regulator
LADSHAPLGREPEYGRAVAFLDRGRHGLAGLVVAGAAGIGKTTIFDATLAEGRGRGFRPLVCRPAAPELQSSFAGLGDLLDGAALDDALPRLAEPQARALEVALGLAPASGALESRLLGRALLAALRALSRGSPLLIAVDDLQWLDAATVEALVFALRRLTDEHVVLLATVRTGGDARESFEFDRALAGRLERVLVGPLSIGAVQRLLRERLGARLPRPLLRRVYELSGGNPFYALELGRGLVERGDERLPESLRGLLADRIERLPEETRRLLVVLAAAAAPGVALVRSLEAERALDAAERAGIVTCEGTTIRFAHPLLAAAALETATARERREAHGRLAGIVDDGEQRARHLAHSTAGSDEEVAATLEAAAAAALARGGPATAAELAEWSVRLTPADYAAALHRRRLEASRRWRTLGNTVRQRALLDEALGASSRGPERAEVLRQLASIAGDEGERFSARALIAEALEDAAGDDVLSAAICLEAVWLDGGFGGSLDAAQRALEHATRSGDPALEAQALSRLGYTSFSHGLGFRRDLFERAVALEEEVGFIDAANRPTTMYGVTAKWAGDIQLSRTLLEQAIARARRDEDASGNIVLFYLAWHHLITGDWSRALACTDEAREIAADAEREGDVAIVLATRAIVEAHLGLFDEAREHLDETSDAAEHAKGLSDTYPVLRSWGAGLLSLLAGQPSDAAALLEPMMSALLARGLVEPGYHPWFPTCAEALIQAGRVEDAEALCEQLEATAVRFERRWPLAVCAHVRGSVAAARGDVTGALEHLDRAATLHEGTGRPFDRACTLLLQGQLLRRVKQRRRARETLEAALGEFERLGAAPWAAQARAELERVGGRAPARGLTPTEARLAALVAAGRSNKQIAGELFVTVRTVETNLSRIYAKLGLHSRGELTAWLNGR